MKLIVKRLRKKPAVEIAVTEIASIGPLLDWTGPTKSLTWEKLNRAPTSPKRIS